MSMQRYCIANIPVSSYKYSNMILADLYLQKNKIVKCKTTGTQCSRVSWMWVQHRINKVLANIALSHSKSSQNLNNFGPVSQ